MLTNNIKFQDAAFTSLQTLLYAGVLGYLLKGIFGRARPEWTNPDDPYAFFDRTGTNPLSHEGNSSYPSGHAIASFGIITPWVLYYPSPFTYALYIIPTGTAFSRLATEKHWATDLAVGTVIGVAMGRWLTHRHQGTRSDESRVRLSMIEDGKVFSLRVRLD
jgi:membrane-associated phospholipid phosphatase